VSWEIVEHTADVRMHVQAATLETLFADSVRALMEVMRAGEGADAPHASLAVEAPDLTALLVDFLNEVLARVHTQRRGFEPESIVLEGLRVRAVLRPLGPFDEDVKAVTYHEADVRRTGGGWTTTLVLDI
jgi:SHS2 domain-containing protein